MWALKIKQLPVIQTNTEEVLVACKCPPAENCKRHTTRGITCPWEGVPSSGQGGTPVLARGYPSPAWGPCPGVPPGRTCDRTWVPLGRTSDRTGVTHSAGPVTRLERTWDRKLGRGLGPDVGVTPRKVLGPEAGKGPGTRG